ncbi:MAG: hypothetical protein EXS32_05220 [Opitutus sp.]|nr:hypothetical protein [Opitutus sp.]
MKTSLRFALFTAALALSAGASAFAQSRSDYRGPRHQPPALNADGTITLRDGTVVTPSDDGTITLPDGRIVRRPPIRNADGSITLSDGTIVLPPVYSDGSIVLPDGTVVPPNADGSITLPDGTVLPPLPHGPSRSPGHPAAGD